MIGIVIVGVLVMCWLARRRHRNHVLSGLSSNKPVFSVECPRRRLTSARGDRL